MFVLLIPPDCQGGVLNALDDSLALVVIWDS